MMSFLIGLVIVGVGMFAGIVIGGRRDLARRYRSEIDRWHDFNGGKYDPSQPMLLFDAKERCAQAERRETELYELRKRVSLLADELTHAIETCGINKAKWIKAWPETLRSIAK